MLCKLSRKDTNFSRHTQALAAILGVTILKSESVERHGQFRNEEMQQLSKALIIPHSSESPANDMTFASLLGFVRCNSALK